MTRSASAFLPRHFQFWPDNFQPETDPAKIKQLYDLGFAGAYHDPVEADAFQAAIEAAGGSLDGEGIANASGLADSFSGKLVLSYLFVEKYYPGCFPGARQETGDCVSHSSFKAALTTACCDVASGKPDEVTGLVESMPDVDPTGIKNGAFSSEAIYWYRGYSGDGWSCEAAANVCLGKSALWPRNNYPDLGVDLRVYSGQQAHKYGSQSPPVNFTTCGQKHLIRTSTKLKTFEAVRDYQGNGYGLSTCGGEGFSSQRDANGYSKRSGSWSHAFPFFGADDRDVIKQAYGEPLVLCSNNWGAWNSGGTRILGTQIDIPPGFWWCGWSAVQARSIIAFSGANGWPSKKLPAFVDLGVG